MNKTAAVEWLTIAYHDLQSAVILYNTNHYADGNLVGMTIEHAKASGVLPSISYDEKSARVAM